eukprot:m.109038 g.109038  ORF g.109038 m.109038 type:complete len:431 (+) comp15880_c0_seq1:163-1455(+)
MEQAEGHKAAAAAAASNPKDSHHPAKRPRKAQRSETNAGEDESGGGGGGNTRPRDVNPDEKVTVVIDGAFRRVEPYDFTYRSHAKGRWVGQPLLALLAKEFQAESESYYKRAIESGAITVNGRQVSPDTVIKDNDLILHRVHRHEPAVSSAPIEIIHQDANIVVINKPSSIPVHPCGRYRHNTAMYLLGHEHQLWDLNTCHRLDRLTSGLLIFAKTIAEARRMEQAIHSREVAKEYICKVRGCFPEGKLLCDKPLEVMSHKLGVSAVSSKGKESSTHFERLRVAPDGSSSIVLCKPHTGRMHQIRVHLQYLGFPILNDPVYDLDEWGADKGKLRDEPDAAVLQRVTDALTRRCQEHDTDSVPRTSDERPAWYRAECTECQLHRPDPPPEDLRLYLHAVRYSGAGFSYEASLPPWAREEAPQDQIKEIQPS